MSTPKTRECGACRAFEGAVGYRLATARPYIASQVSTIRGEGAPARHDVLGPARRATVGDDGRIR
ncbi:hypothetical protein [Streptomyces sviceus]|uniref:hypothetical protein n=1 Tax=Streptomyces sviceus TaxID=285530 RepID=UPI00333263E6